MDFLWKKGALVDLVIRRWSMRAHLNKEDVDIPFEYEVPDIIHLGSKQLLPSRVSKRFLKYENRARTLLRNNSFTFPVGRNNFVPFEVLNKTLEDINKIRDTWIEFKDEFFGDEQKALDYDEQVEWMKEQYPILKSLSYPSKEYLRDRFGFSIALYNLNLPEEYAHSELASQINQQMDTFVGDAVALLRQKTVEICTSLKTRVDSGDIDMRNINSLKKWMEKFGQLNFMDDEEVNTELNKLREELPENKFELKEFPLGKFEDSLTHIIATAQKPVPHRALSI